jgi:hypothetical protein
MRLGGVRNAGAGGAYKLKLNMTQSKNLVEGLTDEILRVTEIKNEYLTLSGGAGNFAALLMCFAIENARKAQASGDILQMIPALQALREFEL